MLASDLPVATVARVSEVLTALPGVDLEVQPMRDYPHGPIGSHVFGYVGAITEDEYERSRTRGYSPNDVIGKDGLEHTYDTYLRGKPGGQRVVVDATGAVVAGSRLPSQAAVPGDTLVTNIDWRLQRIADDALQHGIRVAGGTAAGSRARWSPRIRGRAEFSPGELSQLRSERLRGEPRETHRVLSHRSAPSRSSTAPSPRRRRPARRSRWLPDRRRSPKASSK